MLFLLFLLLPLEVFLPLSAFNRLCSEISSSVCASSVVLEREEVSPDATNDCLRLLPVSLERQEEGSFFSGGVGRGTVRVRTDGRGSNETVEVECSMLGRIGRETIESGEKGVMSPPPVEFLRGAEDA